MKSEDIPVVGAIVKEQTKEEVIFAAVNAIPLIECQTREAVERVERLGKEAAVISLRQQILKLVADYLSTLPERIAVRVESELAKEYAIARPNCKRK